MPDGRSWKPFGDRVFRARC